METIEQPLMPGVTLVTIQTTKFKSSVLGATLLAPLSEETASCNALIPYVLRRGTAKHKDIQSLSAALDDLYGGSIEPSVRKKGETQCIGLVGSFLDDAYTPDGSSILEPAAMLLGDLLLRPALEHGMFCSEFVDGERENLVARISAQKNEKRQYAVTRLTSLMCEGEAYGVNRLGSEHAASKITPASLWARYQALLAQSELYFYYCGSADAGRVAAALKSALKDLSRAEQRDETDCNVLDCPAADHVREFTDHMDVAQGKLSLGFRTGGACLWEDNFPALLVFNAIYGGSTNSKLFMNVREKLSLCYYASSMLERLKGLMLVSSGVEFSRFEQAKNEILHQLQACQTGDFTTEELEAAQRSVINDLRATLDGQGRLEDYWLTQAVAGIKETPDSLVSKIEAVTSDQVIQVAKGIELDSIYYLSGKEA